MTIEAPWSPDQVKALNAYQECDLFHPFTCGNDDHESTSLIATEDGWVCPRCDYRQRWAHGMMITIGQKALRGEPLW